MLGGTKVPRVMLINSNRARSESKAPASRRGSQPLAAAHSGKKRNAEAGAFGQNPPGAAFLGEQLRSRA